MTTHSPPGHPYRAKLQTKSGHWLLLRHDGRDYQAANAAVWRWYVLGLCTWQEAMALHDAIRRDGEQPPKRRFAV